MDFSGQPHLPCTTGRGQFGQCKARKQKSEIFEFALKRSLPGRKDDGARAIPTRTAVRMVGARSPLHHLQLDTRTFVAPLRISDGGTMRGAGGAITDRGPARDTFRVAAAQQLAAKARPSGSQNRSQHGGQQLHSPRNRDDSGMFGVLGEYKAPGSPRNQVEMFYIRGNRRGPQEVRLIGCNPHAKAVYQSPHLANATLAQLSPRGALVKLGRNPSLVPVGDGDDWKTGWHKDGRRLQGDGVKWAGSQSKEKGDTSVFSAAPVAVNSPEAGDVSKLWTRGQAQQRKGSKPRGLALLRASSPVPHESPIGSPAASPIPSILSPLLQAATQGQEHAVSSTNWPRPEGSPWKVIIKKAKRKDRTFEDHAERVFGDDGGEMTQPHQLHRRDQILARIPRQWLHKNLTDIKLVACRIESLPSSFGHYAVNVTSLILEHNLICELPESVGKMIKLKHLGSSFLVSMRIFS